MTESPAAYPLAWPVGSPTLDLNQQRNVVIWDAN